MKGIAAPLAALEGNTLPLAQDGAEGEESAQGEGFDALLALVNAQAPNAPAPVKVLAPSVGVQCAPVAVNKDGQPSPAPKSGAASALDIAPTQVFLPWPGAQAPVVAEPSAPASEAVVDEALASASATLPAAQQAPDATPVQVAQSQPARARNVPVPSAQPAPELPVPEASEVVSKATPKAAPAQRKSAPRAFDERGEQLEAAPATVQNPMTQPLPVPAPNAPKLQPAHASSTPAVSAPSAKKAPVSIAPAPLADTQQESADAAAFAELLSADQPAAEAPAPVAMTAGSEDGVQSLPAQREPARLERSAAPAVRPTLPLSDPETQARVTKIEFFSSTEPAPTSEVLPVDAQPVETTPELEQPESALADQREPSAEGERTDAERTDAEQPASDERSASDGSRQNAAPVARFEVTEGKGMRGLDAVVASLLRPYAEKPEGSGGVRVPTASATHIRVETGKSQGVKIEERVTNVNQALDAAALRRQEEERRGELRELTEPTPQHFTQQLEAQADVPTETPAAQNSAPVNVPAPVQPDPDAAMMGKIARGESLNAAVSIEHPELGSMDVLVQSENGRIDVRATLETPRAAAVLRAHESALRYGVQQAGMTFGALRVNARTGEAKIEKSRDVPKRRRERDWEA